MDALERGGKELDCQLQRQSLEISTEKPGGGVGKEKSGRREKTLRFHSRRSSDTCSKMLRRRVTSSATERRNVGPGYTNPRRKPLELSHQNLRVGNRRGTTTRNLGLSDDGARAQSSV